MQYRQWIQVAFFGLFLTFCRSICAEDAANSGEKQILTVENKQEQIQEASIIETLPLVLDLATVQRRVLENNPTLAAAHARVEQALERIKQAQSLWYPQLKLDYSASHTDLSDSSSSLGGLSGGTSGLSGLGGTGGLGGLGGSGAGGLGSSAATGSFSSFLEKEFESYSLSFRATYILFDGFSRRFSNLIAEYGEEESETLRAEVERQLLNAAANSFYGVQLARENVRIAEADMSFNERLLGETQARRRAGMASLSDELNFEVQIRAARARLIRARLAYENAKVALAALMGLPEAELPEGVSIAELSPEPEGLLAAPTLEEYMAHALEARPDLQQRRLAAERADAAVKRERASWYPQVNVFASYDGRRNEDSSFESDDFSTTVGVSVSYDLFTGGRNRAEIAERKYARSEAERQLDESELRVASEVRREILNLRSSQEQLLLQREAAGFVERNRDLVEKEYDAGQASLTRLTQAQRDLIAAQVELAVARVALRQAWDNLYTAAGRPVTELTEQAEPAEPAAVP